MLRALRLLPVLLAVILAVGVAWPVLSGLGARVPGIPEVDAFGTLWFYALVEGALARGEVPLHTDLLFHPWGKDLYAHTGANVLDAVVAQPFRWLLGPVGGYGAFVLAGLAFGGWAFSRLARTVTEDRVLVLGSAVLWATSPFVLYELAEGRPTQALAGLVPLVLLQARRAAAGPGLRAPLVGGLLLAALGYQYWYYGLFGALVVAAHGAGSVACGPDRRGVALRHLLLLAVALVLALPGSLPLLLRTQLDPASVPGLLDLERLVPGALDPVTREGHPVALLTWQPLSGAASFLVRSEGRLLLVDHQRLLPAVALPAVLLLFVVRPGRLPRLPLLAGLVVAGAVAAGPLVAVGSRAIPNPGWWLGVEALGAMQRLWWPSRAFAFVLALGTLALTASLAAWRLGGAGRGLAVAALLVGQGAWLQRAGLFPFPTWDARVPAGYRCLADPDGPPGAILELPWGWTQAHLYWQATHGRPMLGGMLENNPVFAPEAATRFRVGNSFVAALVKAAQEGGDPATWTPEDAAAVRDLGYRYVVLQRDAWARPDVGPAGVTALRTRLRGVERTLARMLGEPAWSDGRVVIWAPWGDPPPCGPGVVAPDPEPVPWPRYSSTGGLQELGRRELRQVGVAPVSQSPSPAAGSRPVAP